MSVTALGFRPNAAVRIAAAQLTASPAGVQALQGEVPAPDGSGQPKVNAFASALTQISKFIPGDVVTLYITLIGLVRNASGSSSSTLSISTAALSQTDAIYISCVVLTPLWVIAVRYISTKAGEPFIWPIWPSIAATLAFVIYGLACNSLWSPGVGPFSLPPGLTQGLVFFSSPILALLNEVVGRRLPTQRV
jgi:hypothetical protein